MERNFRIHTNIINDTVLSVNMKQDFDMLEVLSLKLTQADAYKLHSSNYGVIIGRVLANDAFGIPNARVSVFIAKEENEVSDIEALYPYSSVRSTDKDGKRYNLLPDYSDDECYRVVGTFPNKRLVLDNNTVLEVFDKYWKYSTVTNNAGDYMLFGIPTGNQELTVDIDLSDIGILSQRPTDFKYKGYNMTMFDSPTQFKGSTNLAGLPQLFNQNKSVFVYPFWGDADNGIAAITRSDIQIQYKFEPTCVFMGSIISDNDSNAINHKCAPTIDNGKNDQMITGEGNIEMIRKTPDGLVEEYHVQNGESLIDANGVWCYQIPMNLDYIGTDEYGNIVPTDNPSKGIPTRTQVRFRISKNETGDEGFSRHTAKYLVPMNPTFDETITIPTVNVPGKEIEKMYNFGSNTPQSCFRDLYWNNVYSVKNYIPKVQVAHRITSKHYSSLKGSNLAGDKNEFPFNKLRFDIPFVFMVLCIVYRIMYGVIGTINVIASIVNALFWPLIKLKQKLKDKPILKFLAKLIPAPNEFLPCQYFPTGGEDDTRILYYPRCAEKISLKNTPCPDDMPDCIQKKPNKGEMEELLDKVQQNLANEFKIVKLDLYQDWINGVLYMPLWYWKKRKKRSFLFGLIKLKGKNQFCSCDKTYSRLKTFVSCNFIYKDDHLGLDNNGAPEDETRWHKDKKTSGRVKFKRGLIKQVENRDSLNIYYYSALQATDDNKNPGQTLEDRDADFKAIRLYATDIILLGNLSENNMYGIPQLFKSLPSTTANVPPIATISEPTKDLGDEAVNNNDMLDDEDSGFTITTGMDWGYNKRANKDKPKFSRGLFMDLACTYVSTKAKSCINVERLSELGVNYDMNYETSYRSASNVLMGGIDPDGFISKYELDDLENRAMFATMNHIGFIPQAYQDQIGGYTTQVNDKNTNYLIPKFQYLYPTDFDGRLQVLMNRYKNGFSFPQTDRKDDSYVAFRLGEIKTSDGVEKRKTHFYLKENGGWSMPLYNNSFYFYFGLNKGNTAIDKFNHEFFAECFQNSKDWFSFDVEKQGESYCVSAYTTSASSCDNFDNDRAHGKIKISSDDIQIPYSYELINASGTVVSSDTEITSDEVLICGIENGQYTIKLTDGNGKTRTAKTTLERDPLSIVFDTVSLGTKFYGKEMSSYPYICNDDATFYGKIIISGFTVDGFDGRITNVYNVSDSGNVYTFDISGVTDYQDNVVITSSLYVVSPFEEGDTTKDCMCSGGTNQVPTLSIVTTRVEGVETKHIEFNVYEPAIFALESYQKCEGGIISGNSSNVLITVDNGLNFNVYLNEMPLRFMLGTVEDDASMSISNNSHFYKTTVVTSPTGHGLDGWFNVHNESAYTFDVAEERNELIWDDFIDYSIFSSMETKRDIIMFKFRSMFSVANTTYVTGSFNTTYEFIGEGGNSPLLTRLVAPYYEDEINYMAGKCLYEDNDTVTIDTSFPNIVGSNYIGANGTSFNPNFYKGSDKGNRNGNYFAVFTNNGGYTGRATIDNNINVRRIPNYAAVNALDNQMKPLGDDLTGVITMFNKAYNSGQTMPHFRAMCLDRRFDYDLIVFAPINDYPLGVPSLSGVSWFTGRISGVTYNGIEMSYDDEYNIVSANSVSSTTTIDGEEVSGITYSANTELEYSYSISSSTGDCATVFNQKPSVKRRPYDANILLSDGYRDLRDKFWSTNNENIGNDTNWNISVEDWSGGTPLYYPYHSGDTGYNGDFSIDNYPTKRIIDVANIEPNVVYSLQYTPCSYNGSFQVDENGSIKYIIKPGITEELNISFEQGIEFVDNEIASNGTSNIEITPIIYEVSGDGNSYLGTRPSLSYKFRMALFEPDNGSTVYTTAPRIFRAVLQGMGDIKVNNIEILKKMLGASKEEIDNFINRNSDKIKHKDIFSRPDDEIELVDKSPNNIEPTRTDEGGFAYLKRGNEFLTSDDEDFHAVVFDKTVEVATKCLYSAMIFKRTYIDNSEYLTKYISTYEINNLVDMRPVNVKVLSGSNESGSWKGTYVTKHVHEDSSVTYNQTIEVSISGSIITPGVSTNAIVAVNDEIFGIMAYQAEVNSSVSGNEISISAKFPSSVGYINNGSWSNKNVRFYVTPLSGTKCSFFFRINGTTNGIDSIGDGQSAATTNIILS